MQRFLSLPTLQERASGVLREVSLAQRLLLVALVATGLAAAFALARYAEDAVRRDGASAFRAEARRHADAIRIELVDLEHDLEALSLVISRLPEVQAAEFADTVRFVRGRRASVGTVLWAERVPAAGLEAYEARMRARSRPDFAVVEEGPGGRDVPAGPRTEYFPATFREPMPAAGSAFGGYDLMSSEARGRAMTLARDSGAGTMTDPIRMRVEPGLPLAVKVMMPVYTQRAMLPDVQSRRDRLRGFVVAAVSMAGLLDAALPGELPAGWSLALDLKDAAAGTSRLGARGDPAAPADYAHEVAFTAAGRPLVATVRGPLPPPTALAYLPAALALAATLLLAALVLSEWMRGAARLSAERRVRGLIDASPEAVAVKDAGLRYRLVNRAFCERARLAPQQVIGRTNEELFGDTLPPHVREAEAACARTGERQRYEFRADGEAASRWFEAVAVPFGEGPRRDGSIVVTVRDITERKDLESARDLRARDALRASDERFRALALLGSDWFWEQDAELRFLRPAAEDADASRRLRVLGDIPVGLRRWEIPGIEAAPGALDAHRAAVERHEAFRDFEYSVPGPDGERVWFSASGEPMIGADGAFRGYRGTGRNITGERRREDRLRESEARFRALAELSSDWYWEQDADGRFIAIGDGRDGSPQSGDVGPPGGLGRARWELPGLVGDPAAMAGHRAAVLERHEPFRNFEYGLRLEDGSLHWYSTSGTPVFDAAGRFRGYRGTGRDITARRRAAEVERELSEQRRAVLENLLAAVIVIDERGTIETFSRQAEAIFGFAAHEVLGRNVSILVPEPYRGRHDGYLERYAATGERRVIGATRELYGVRKDGSEVPIELGITEILVDGRRKYTGMVRDLTTRRAAQDALVASEERFRSLFENSPEAIVVQDGREIAAINPAGVALLGATSAGELAGRYLGDFAVGAGERAEGEARQRQLLESVPSRLPMREYTFQGLDGVRRQVEAVSASFRTPDGTRIMTIYRDVTERHAARAALEASEDRFRRLFDVSPDGVALHDGRSFELLNAEALRILGARTQEEVVGRGVLEFFLEEPERASAAARLQQARGTEGAPTPMREYRLRTLDGVERYAESSTIAIPGSGGQRFMSVVRDTTERRRAEQAIRLSEARLREVMDLVPHFIFVKDREGRYLMANRAYAEFFGHTTETIVGQRPHDLGIAGAELQAIAGADARVRETGEQRYLPEQKVMGPDGRTRTYSTLRIPFRFSEEHPDAVLAVSIDVTEIRESERRLREILDVVPHPIYAKDREGRYLLSNRAHAAFYGRAPEEIVGSTGGALAANDRERGAMAAGDGRVFERLQRDYQPDVLRTDAAGRARHMNLTKIPFSYHGGEPDSLLGISIDVTDLVEAHAKVRESLALLEATLEATDNGFMVTDAGGRIVRWNRRLMEIFGLSLELLEQGDRARLVEATQAIFADVEAVRAAAREAASNPDYAGVFTAALADGRFVERYTQPLMRDGLPAGRVWSYRDVTARERERVEAAEREAVLEQRVDERTVELTKAVADLTLFTSAISHDLRAPLRAVGGFVDMAIEDGGPTLAPPARRHLERVVNAVRNMNAMVEGLLALARQTRAPIHRQPVDVAALAREVFDELSQGAAKAVEFRASPCPAANADPVLLRNVLQNLIGNALKYSRKHERPVIEVGAVGREGAPEWFVRDNGAGFDPKYADKLFQPFGRLHSPREFEGTGIGLAAAKRILERHGGRIRAEARPGEGATFWFTLS